MAEVLSIELTAKITDFINGLGQASTASKKTGDDINKMGKDIDDTINKVNKQNLNPLSNALKKFAADSLSYGTSIRKGLDITSKPFDGLAESLLVINGNAQLFGKTLQTDIATLSAYKSQINSMLAQGIKPTSKEILTLTTQVDVLNKRIIQAQSPFSKLSTGSNQAAFALTNLGRVAQDAPFGFIAIQNNLNPLLESFQRLRAETGSGGAALKALGSTLIGPAGLGIALSLVTAGITYYVQKQQQAKKAAKEAQEANEDYAKSLDAVSRGLLKGDQDASASLVNLKLLYHATQDTTLSISERNKAVDALQKQYPKYFDNLTNEAILAGKATTKYNELTASIIAKARASALEDELKDNAKLLRTLEKRDDLNKKALVSAKQIEDTQRALVSGDLDQLKAQEAKNKALQKGVDLRNITPNKEAIQITKTDSGEEKSLKQANQLRSEALTIQKQRNDALKEEKSLVGAIEAIIKSDGVDAIIPDSDKADKTGKKIKTLAEIMKELAIDLQQVDAEFNLTFGEKANKKIDSYQKAIGDLISIGYDPATEAVLKLKKAQQDLFQLPQLKDRGITDLIAPKNTAKVGGKEDTSFGDNLDQFSLDATVARAKILADQDKFNQDFDRSLKQLGSASLTDAIGGGLSSIGEALVSGGNIIEAAGTALLGTLGSFLSELGSMLISKGLATVLAGHALMLVPGGQAQGAQMTAGGYGLIAAGAALALGSGVISGIGGGSGGDTNNSNVTAFANGGIISGPTLGLMGEYSGAKTNPEVVAPLNKLKSMLGDTSPQFEVVQYIEGDKLAVMVRNANKRLNRI